MSLELHRTSVVADAHNDLLIAVTARPPKRWASFFRERWLPQLQEGGVNLQVLPVFIGDAYRPEGALRETLRMIECAHVLAEGNQDSVRLCLDGDDIDAAHAAGKIALVLALESAPGVDASVELFPTLFRLGVRVASLAHWRRTALADGSGEDATGSRLTEAGVEALGIMESLGMIYDVSHLSASGVRHVLELATRPVMATHSSARALRDHHRNLTDDQLRGIAATGGTVCVNFLPEFLAEDPADATLHRLTDHFLHVLDVVGPDHIGIGADFIEEVDHDTMPRCCEEEPYAYPWSLPGLSGPRGLPLVTDALVGRGVPEETVRKILGGNVLELFRKELGRGRAVQCGGGEWRRTSGTTPAD